MQISKLATLFPPMSDDEFQNLKSDIEKNGVIEPIWVHVGEVIDGRHRYKACIELDIDCPMREYEGDDILSFVLSLNMHRRHLTASQRALIAAELATLGKGQHRENEVTQAEAAKIMGTSVASLKKAKKVLDDEDMVEKVRNGDITINAALSKDKLAKNHVAKFSYLDDNNAQDQEVDDEVDFVQMCDELQKEVERCHALLEADDTLQMLDKLSRSYSQLEGRLQAQITEANEAKAQAKYYKLMLDKIKTKLSVDSYKDILDFI